MLELPLYIQSIYDAIVSRLTRKNSVVSVAESVETAVWKQSKCGNGQVWKLPFVEMAISVCMCGNGHSEGRGLEPATRGEGMWTWPKRARICGNGQGG